MADASVEVSGTRIFYTRYAPLFFAVYIAEGIITVFFSINTVYLTELGIPLSSVGVLGSVALLPLLAKPFIGVLSDYLLVKRGLKRSTFVSGFLAVQCLALLALAVIDPVSAFAWYMISATLMIGALAFYDVCTDGLALDLAGREKYGATQSFMTSGRYGAVLVLPPVITFVAAHYSWSLAFGILAALSLQPILLLLRVEERPVDTRRSIVWGDFRQMLRLPALLGCAVGFMTMLTTSGPEEVWLAYLKSDVGISLPQTGLIGTVFGVGTIAGAILGARLFDGLGWLRCNYVTAIIIAVSVALLSAIANFEIAAVFGFAFGIAMGVCHISAFGLGMIISKSEANASSFAVFSTFMALGTIVAFSLAAWLAETVGYRWSFIVTGLLALANVILLWVLARRGRAEDPARYAPV